MPVQIGLSQILVLCYFATEKRALKKLEGEYECNKYFIFVAHRALFCISALASSQHSSKFQHLWTCFGNLWFPLDFHWRWATTVQASSCTPAMGGVSPKLFSYVGFGSMHTLCCLFIYFFLIIDITWGCSEHRPEVSEHREMWSHLPLWSHGLP